MPLNHAIDEAIDYCLEHNMLTDVLLKNRSEVAHMLLTEFDEKKFAKTMWTEGYESGHEVGYESGHEAGYESGHEAGSNVVIRIMKEINKGNDTVEKLTALGYDEEQVKSVLDVYSNR